MFYVATLKKLYDAVKTDDGISNNDKQEILKHITTLINLLALC